jgi:hypothetical protein
MKHSDFQKMLKQLKEKGMYLNDEIVVVRRDIYDMEMAKARRFVEAKRAIEQPTKVS